MPQHKSRDHGEEVVAQAGHRAAPGVVGHCNDGHARSGQLTLGHVTCGHAGHDAAGHAGQRCKYATPNELAARQTDSKTMSAKTIRRLCLTKDKLA